VEIQGNAGKEHIFVKLTGSAYATVNLQVSAYFTFPDFYSLLIESVGVLLELDDPAPEKLQEKLAQIATTLTTRTLAQMAHNAVIVGSVTLAPLGVHARPGGAARAPANLTDYPARPGSRAPRPRAWRCSPPPCATGCSPRTTGAACRRRWRRSGCPRGRARRHHLLDTFFPHGGLIGAGFLMVPSFFTEPPPVQEFLTVLDGHKDLMARARRRSRWWGSWPAA